MRPHSAHVKNSNRAESNNNKNKNQSGQYSTDSNPQQQVSQQLQHQLQHQHQHQQLPTSSSQIAASPQARSNNRNPVKVVKSKTPLSHFRFYLDIRDNQLTKKIEEQIKIFGGCLEFFLTPSVTHFITDKTVLSANVSSNINNVQSSTPQTPGTPSTPQTPCSIESYDSNLVTPGVSRKTKSRADAILNRAVRQNSISSTAIEKAALKHSKVDTLPFQSNEKNNYSVWQAEYALKFFKKVQYELKAYLDTKNQNSTNKTRSIEPIYLKGSYIKIEAIKHNNRPYYQIFKKPSEWPKIELKQEEGAFRLSPKKNHDTENHIIRDQDKHKMTRKSRSRSSQVLRKSSTGAKRNSTIGAPDCKQAKETSEKQCGVCEICKIEYDVLTIHLKTKDHEYFARNNQNFIALDTLINSSADVNKFLEENKNNIKPELEEVEVDEKMMDDGNINDPLDNAETSLNEKACSKTRSGASKTPSPTLREKSKRSTKGKHSSEKFQNSSKLSAKSPKTLPKPASPTKKVSSNATELESIELAASTSIPIASSLRKKSTVALSSPPIRAMLPPSSLYKVVETHESCATQRKLKDAGDQVPPSPSIIVKFKKVRQTEVLRLNGEAENFMFPKQRASSELPTDTDRQTSDDVRASVSSVSLESTSDALDIDHENSEKLSQDHISITSQRAKISAKRRKGQQQQTQSFPSAPIQPEVQLKRTRKPSAVAADLMVATTGFTLPEATRKSSRTATAIVSAATTSSRLICAAVKAAKNNCLRMANNEILTNVTSTSRKRSFPVESTRTTATKVAYVELPTTSAKQRRETKVVEMEDRMGEYDFKSDGSDNETNLQQNNVIDLNDESDDEQDDVNDEDYLCSKDRYYKRRKSLSKTKPSRKMPIRKTKPRSGKSRQRRKRSSKISAVEDSDISIVEDELKEEESNISNNNLIVDPVDTVSFLNMNSTSSENAAGTSPRDRLNTLLYSFERVPTSELWYKVFSRQDACQEQYFEYYGSTKYRKLPYELGPMPFDSSYKGCPNCELHQKKTESKSKIECNIQEATIEEKPAIINNSKQIESNITTETPNKSKCTPTTSQTLQDATVSSQYTHKHKKLHLLHRYQQEQRELQQRKMQQLQDQQKVERAEDVEEKSFAIDSITAAQKCDSKSSTPDREGRDRGRAGSTHSNASSYASSSATAGKRQYRNKHLNKSAFLNLELPPRKSPREHASTLALVSCIIKQRQDSQSKPNSETDEPAIATTSTSITAIGVKEERQVLKYTTNEVSEMLTNTYSCAATLNATMPISAQTTTTTTVPTTPPTTTTVLTSLLPTLPTTSLASTKLTRLSTATPVEELRFATEISENVKRLRRGQNKYDHSPPVIVAPIKRKRGRPPRADKLLMQQHSIIQKPNVRRYRKRNTCNANIARQYNGGVQTHGLLPSIRKTGSKKGVLEFEVDNIALQALEAATQYTNVRHMEWEIDKYLETAYNDLDVNAEVAGIGAATDDAVAIVDLTTEHTNGNDITALPNLISSSATHKSTETVTSSPHTPPPTDCFSSDFDLYDLFTNINNNNGSDEEQCDGKQRSVSLYNSVALHSYFRRRKNLKSNRTGWPKAQKKKTSSRQQQMLRQKIRFLQNVNDEVKSKEEPVDNNIKDSQTRESEVIITPPDSEMDENTKIDTNNDDEEEEAEDTEIEAAESIPEEDDAETIADSIEDEREDDADADADVDEEGDDEAGGTADEDYEVNEYLGRNKRARRSAALDSPIDKLSNSLNACSNTAATSTPSTQMLRTLRQTPQLNGSLGSCISPSDKGGDNSDIFTVSSDGLETDLDLSNSQSQLRGGDDEHHENCSNHTPKRKFDLGKYALKNTSTTNLNFGTEAKATVVKALPLSHFLKKEVRVNCRRLRAPFRRFRYRR